MPSPVTVQDLTLMVKATPDLNLTHAYSLWYFSFALAFLIAPLVSAQVNYLSFLCAR